MRCLWDHGVIVGEVTISVSCGSILGGTSQGTQGGKCSMIDTVSHSEY